MKYRLILSIVLGLSNLVYAQESSSEIISTVNDEISNLQSFRLRQQELDFFEKIGLEEYQNLEFNPPLQILERCGWIPSQESVPEIILSLKFQGSFETWVPIDGNSYKESFWKVNFNN